MAHFNIDSLPMLLPDETYSCVFTVAKVIGAPVRCAGSPQIKWCSYMGEHAMVYGADAIAPPSTETGLHSPSIHSPTDQGHSQGQYVRIDCVTSPPSVPLGEDFPVLLRITNNTIRSLPLHLIGHPDTIAPEFFSGSTLMGEYPAGLGGAPGGRAGGQLIVTGLSKAQLGVLAPGESVDWSVTVCGVDVGLQELRGLCVVSGEREYPAKPVLKVLVTAGV
jgi:hypothetical protein